MHRFDRDILLKSETPRAYTAHIADNWSINGVPNGGYLMAILEFSVNVRNLPATAWLKGVFRTRFITCGLLEEDGEIWDQNGVLIAISRQIAQYRAQSK